MVYFEIKGIKCDSDNCNYSDMTIKFSEYPKWINKPCPICGSNLLTQSEYDNCLKQYSIVYKFNKVINILKWLNPAHYWRLIFGDKRSLKTLTINFPKRK